MKGLPLISTLLFSHLLNGCTGSLQGAPPRLAPAVADISIAIQASRPELYQQYFSEMNIEKKRALRDQIVLARMYGIDINYLDYEAKLTRERQEIGFIGTVTNLALTSTASLAGSKETKAILSAAATGLTGVNEAYENEVLLDRTVAVIQQQMRAERKLVRASILTRLEMPVIQYPLELALSDVESYYRAGSVTSALIGVSQQSGLLLRNAEETERQAIVTRYQQSDIGDAILTFWRASQNNKNRIQQWMADNNISLNVPFSRAPENTLPNNGVWRPI